MVVCKYQGFRFCQKLLNKKHTKSTTNVRDTRSIQLEYLSIFKFCVSVQTDHDYVERFATGHKAKSHQV